MGGEGREGKGEETESEESDVLHFHSFACLILYVSSTLVHATPSTRLTCNEQSLE